MAFKNPEHQKGRPFPKGVSGNPSGRTKLPAELKKIKPFTTEEVERLIAKYLRMTTAQLNEVVHDKKSPAIAVLFGSIIIHCAKSGDYSKLDFLLNRTIGRVSEAAPAMANTTAPNIKLVMPDNGR